MADPRTVGAILSAVATAAKPVGTVVGALSAPAGLAVAVGAALLGVAGDVLQGDGAPVVYAQDPGPLLDAMRARIAARQKAQVKP